MLKSFNLSHFISTAVTEREQSLLAVDLFQFDSELRAKLEGKSVLVIGGAGTIGSSFIKAALKFKIGRLYVFDINENGLTELVRDLRSSEGYHIPADFKTYPINFGDAVFEKILKNEGPFNIVANFAAHKHVRSEKDQYSIEAMIENNVIRAKKLLDLLVKMPPEHFFCVSTDKAANPVNVMGASKKLMEDVILAYSQKIHITTARFANVAFSNGSLPLGFIERLMKKQPFSSPSDVKRYFVSPEESGQICLMACILGNSGEIFFPKLQESQMKKFSDIAVALLKELGYEPDYCQSEEEAKQKALNLKPLSKKYPVYFFKSDTSGEKHYEEFYTGKEEIDLKTFRNLGVIKNAEKKPIADVDKIFKQLIQVFESPNVDKQKIVAILSTFIPDFKHLETGKSLDQKM
jgi:FlaA1/EpsC-like NDP-sugar epimerase